MLQSTGSQKVRHDLATEQQVHINTFDLIFYQSVTFDTCKAHIFILIAFLKSPLKFLNRQT